MTSEVIQGFKAISISLSKESTSPHSLFVKEHSLRHQEEAKPPGRTLFVLNIPPYVTEEGLKSLFLSVGKILNVTLQNVTNTLHNGFRTAHIVFAKREGLLKALQATTLHVDHQFPFKTGLDKWTEEYNNSIGDSMKLSKEISNFMLSYDKSEENKKQIKEVDDEGWTVVTKKGRKPGIAHKESVKIKINEKISQASKKKELKNFYVFQIKESKMRNLAMLRKNYEEAKNKVNVMKCSRRFKPY